MPRLQRPAFYTLRYERVHQVIRKAIAMSGAEPFAGENLCRTYGALFVFATRTQRSRAGLVFCRASGAESSLVNDEW